MESQEKRTKRDNLVEERRIGNTYVIAAAGLGGLHDDKAAGLVKG
jgi:hypothetical protein